MGAGLGFLELEDGTAGDDLAAVVDEVPQGLAQLSSFGRPATIASMLMPKEHCIWVCL